MSIGYGGRAHLQQDDGRTILYTYCCYDVNSDNWQEMKETEDGELWIERSALVEPVIRERIKRLPSGRKQTQIKRIERDAHIGDLLSKGEIVVRNASGTWKTRDSGADMIALALLRIIFSDYQKNGEIPQTAYMFV